MRPRRVWLLLAAGAVAVVVTAGAVGLTRLLDHGVTYGTAALGEIRHTEAPAIGANTFLHREADPAKIRRELEVLRQAGVGLVRQEFNWAEFEPLDSDEHPDIGRDAWVKYDQIVEAARGAGIEVLARLDRAPAWATPGFDPRSNPWMQAPPADNADFADFAGQLATRYRGKVRYYQIWNEPNLLGEWGGRPPDPAEYLAMLRAVGQAIRAADPDARIVLAGLAPTIETGPDNLSDLLFLRTLYQLGAKGDFDVAASMSYGLWTGPRDPRIDDQRVNFPRAVLWREAMLEFGDAQTPVWAAEYGWMSLPAGWTGEPGIWGNHPVEDQAAWTVDGIRRAREQWPWMPTIVIWASRWPEEPDPQDPTPYFRLMDKDFRPRPNLEAVREAFAAPAAAGVGLSQETHPAVSYDGPWPRVPSNLASLTFHRQTGVAGARVSFRFEGTDVGLLTRRGPDMGRVLARIDGQDALADALPRNPGGEAILDLYAASVEPLARIPIATRLPPGPHTLELTVLARSNPASTGGLVIVDGLLVGNARPTWPWLALGALWALVGALGIWTARTWLGARRVLAAMSWSWMDRQVGPVRLGELVLAVAAVLYAVLPAGGLTSLWTFLRVLLVLALGVLALARLRDAALVAVAAIPFVGVIGRTGLIDRPVGEILLLAVVAAWMVRALWCGPPKLPSGSMAGGGGRLCRGRGCSGRTGRLPQVRATGPADGDPGAGGVLRGAGLGCAGSERRAPVAGGAGCGGDAGGAGCAGADSVRRGGDRGVPAASAGHVRLAKQPGAGAGTGRARGAGPGAGGRCGRVVKGIGPVEMAARPGREGSLVAGPGAAGDGADSDLEPGRLAGGAAGVGGGRSAAVGARGTQTSSGGRGVLARGAGGDRAADGCGADRPAIADRR